MQSTFCALLFQPETIKNNVRNWSTCLQVSFLSFESNLSAVILSVAAKAYVRRGSVVKILPAGSTSCLIGRVFCSIEETVGINLSPIWRDEKDTHSFQSSFTVGQDKGWSHNREQIGNKQLSLHQDEQEKLWSLFLSSVALSVISTKMQKQFLRKAGLEEEMFWTAWKSFYFSKKASLAVILIT